MWEKFFRQLLKKIVVDELANNKKFQQFVVDVESKIKDAPKNLLKKDTKKLGATKQKDFPRKKSYAEHVFSTAKEELSSDISVFTKWFKKK